MDHISQTQGNDKDKFKKLKQINQNTQNVNE